MKLSSHIAFLLQLTAASAATTKVLRKSVESTRSLSSSFNKQQEYLAKLPAALAKNGNAVAAARHGSDVSVECFTDTITDYDFDEYVTDDPDCAAEGSFISCDYSSIGLSECTEAGGTIVRETLNYCEENFIATNYPTCVAPSCDNDVTYSEIMIDFALPISYALFGGEELFMMTLEEFIYISGFGGACPSVSSSKAPKSSKSPSSKAPKSSKSPSSKAPKSSKSPSSKAPKSSKSPSSKAPKSSKSPSSKAPKTPSSKAPKATKTPKATSAPSSKAPKSTKAPETTKAPKSTKAPGAAASSSATASMSAASVAAGALVWFSL